MIGILGPPQEILTCGMNVVSVLRLVSVLPMELLAENVLNFTNPQSITMNSLYVYINEIQQSYHIQCLL